MPNFDLVTPANVALAMVADTPRQALIAMECNLSQDSRFTRTYSLDCTDVTWRATSLAVRHGMLMQWLAVEIKAWGGL